MSKKRVGLWSARVRESKEDSWVAPWVVDGLEVVESSDDRTYRVVHRKTVKAAVAEKKACCWCDDTTVVAESGTSNGCAEVTNNKTKAMARTGHGPCNIDNSAVSSTSRRGDR